ncbi:MAG TPA: hypothetical protein PK156_36785 [Polyangium sp.]|nr:hypothetical protein [Polyangium sp.]
MHEAAIAFQNDVVSMDQADIVFWWDDVAIESDDIVIGHPVVISPQDGGSTQQRVFVFAQHEFAVRHHEVSIRRRAIVL